MLESGQLEAGVLIRLNALQRVQPCSTLLLPHCMDTNEVDTAARHKYEDMWLTAVLKIVSSNWPLLGGGWFLPLCPDKIAFDLQIVWLVITYKNNTN